MKKAWHILYSAFTWILMITAFVVMVFTVISVTTVDRNNREIFGYKAYIVLSDSMSATDFDAGDVVVIRQTDASSLQPGDIITFVSRNTHNYGENVTHKIRRSTTMENGLPGFVTYGTTTGIDDEAAVGYSDVLGKYQFSIAKLGTFFQFLKTPKGYICCILIPFLLLIGIQGINCIQAFRAYKADQLQQLQAEKRALEQERRRTEEMMERLMQMQTQLLGANTPKETTEKPDIDALLAELEQLRAQLKTEKKEENPNA